MCPPIRDRANSLAATSCGLRKCHSCQEPISGALMEENRFRFPTPFRSQVPDTFSPAAHFINVMLLEFLGIPEDVREDRAKRLMLELERLASHDEPQPLGSYRPEGSNGSGSANNTEKREGLGGAMVLNRKRKVV